MFWGYEIDREGDALRLVLYWGARGTPGWDYTVFTHVVQCEQMVAQSEQQPLAGSYPTSMRREGESLRDVYSLPLPSPGAEIRVGLYDPTTMQCLSRPDMRAGYVTVKPYRGFLVVDSSEVVSESG